MIETPENQKEQILNLSEAVAKELRAHANDIKDLKAKDTDIQSELGSHRHSVDEIDWPETIDLGEIE